MSIQSSNRTPLSGNKKLSFLIHSKCYFLGSRIDIKAMLEKRSFANIAKRCYPLPLSFLKKSKIGPHKKEIIDTIVGSLLGDGWGENRSNSTRFSLHYSSKSVEYLAYLQNLFYKNGYTSSNRAKSGKIVGKSGKIYHTVKMRTFSYASFNYLYDAFYLNKKKIVPKDIVNLLNARVLSIWTMDDGGTSGSGVKISTESFSFQEVKSLQKALFEKFNLYYTIQRHKQKHILYLSKAQLPLLEKIVKPFMIPCMYYKLNIKNSCS